MKRIPTVGYQGVPGAFSEVAALEFFGAARPKPFDTFREIFEAVKARRIDCGIVPIENTLAGSILENYDHLLHFRLHAVGEHVLRIVHNLITLPGVKAAGIRTIHSHPVALAQCKRFLRRHSAWKVVPAFDTAGSVRDMLRAGARDRAAIASARAAAVYRCRILAKGIEDHHHNYTRFLIVTRTPNRGPADKASLVIEAKHRPGSLHRILGAFASRRINLTKLESRPIPGKPWEYFFYIDIAADPDAPAARAALAEVRRHTDLFRLVGRYRKSPLSDLRS